VKDKVYKYLNEAGIDFEIYDHPALYTVADNDKYGLVFDGVSCKNLFLRNKRKSKYYLISMSANEKISLGSIVASLGEEKVSFANEEELFDKLGIKSGAVSLLNIIEVGTTDVVFVLDKRLLSEKKVGFHPNDNTATIFFNGCNLKKILEDFKVEYRLLDISKIREKK